MTSPSEAKRRNAALQTMRQFAAESGFTMGEVREVDRGDEVRLVTSAPDGREFGVGYAKDDKLSGRPQPANYEGQGTSYDPDAVGYERVGRKQRP